MKILESTTIVFSASIVVGMLLDLKFLKNYLSLFLIIAMSLSLTHFLIRKKMMKKTKNAFLLFLANYFFLTALIIIFSFFLIREEVLLKGMIILALAPPAVAIVPFTYIFRGEKDSSLLAEISSYLAALLIIPISFILFFGKTINVFVVLKNVLLLIAMPIILSRILLFSKAKISFDKEIINLAFFLINATVISLNRGAIINNFFSPLTLVLFLLGLVFPIAIFLACISFKTEKRFAVSLTLFSALKNGGLAAVFAISLFSTEASLPMAISVFPAVILYIFFPLLRKI